MSWDSTTPARLCQAIADPTFARIRGSLTVAGLIISAVAMLLVQHLLSKSLNLVIVACFVAHTRRSQTLRFQELTMVLLHAVRRDGRKCTRNWFIVHLKAHADYLI